MPNNDTPDEQDGGGPVVRPFAAVLQELNRGQVHHQLSEELHALVDAVREHGTKGTLTLALDVAPIAKGDTSALTVAAKVACKAPTAPQTSAFFVDSSGNLSRRDPRQTALPIPADETPVRSVR